MLTLDEFRSQICQTQAAIADSCPIASLPRWFRPPWASLTVRQSLYLWREGWRVALWSASCGDRSISATVECVTNAALRVCSRDILLMHDAASITPNVLETLLPELCRRGIGSFTLDDEVMRASQNNLRCKGENSTSKDILCH